MSRLRVLFVAATQMEVATFLDSYDCRQQKSPGYTLFHPQKGDWACAVTGPGVFNTAAGLGACLSAFVPGIVIDVGIAGIFPGAGPGIGDLALAESETYLHTGVGESLPLPFDLIPGQAGTRDGMYAMDKKTMKICRAALKSKGFEVLCTGPFLTVSSITDSRQKAAALATARPYLMENMEGAAVAHVCALHDVPMAEIRAGSNIAGERDKTQWDIPAACAALGRALASLKDIVPGK